MNSEKGEKKRGKKKQKKQLSSVTKGETNPKLKYNCNAK